MADAIASLAAVFQLADSAHVELRATGATAFQDDHSYMVGCLLGLKNKFPGLKGMIPIIWRVKSSLSLQDEGDRFIFQFDRESERNKILHGGLWHYKNMMMVLGEYDGIVDPQVVPLKTLETWVGVCGLAPQLRNKVVLSLIGSSMGRVIRFDQPALKRKGEEQRIWLELDIRRRVRVVKIFSFSSKVEPELSFNFECMWGFCKVCGLFEYDVIGCDKLFLFEKEDKETQGLEEVLQRLSIVSVVMPRATDMGVQDGQESPTVEVKSRGLTSWTDAWAARCGIQGGQRTTGSDSKKPKTLVLPDQLQTRLRAVVFLKDLVFPITPNLFTTPTLLAVVDSHVLALKPPSSIRAKL